MIPTAASPQSILLFERIHYDWLHEELIARMQERYGTRFTILTPNNATAARRQKVLAENGRIIYFEHLDAASEEKREDEIYTSARQFEEQYGITYFRDLIQQDRWISSSFIGYASDSFFATHRPESFAATFARINSYFRQLEAIFEEREIDCALGWPSYNLCTAVATHIAIANGKPVSFLAPGRRDFRLMWSDGPYVGPRLVQRSMDAIGFVADAPPQREPPSDTQAAIAELPRELQIKTHLKRAFALSRDHAIWAVKDRINPPKARRPKYIQGMKRIFRDFRKLKDLKKYSEASFEKVTEKPFIFFPLPYEPEFPNTSLSREFNDSLAFLKQTALALPAGYRLVVKEHVVGVGHRPDFFMREIVRIPNVIVADNSIRGLDLVSKCAAVASLNGTAGLEAAYFGKKAVLFSKNVEYFMMPHVLYAQDLRDLPKLLKAAVSSTVEPTPEKILASAATHAAAIEELTVDVSHIDVFGGGDAKRLASDEYDKLIAQLCEVYFLLSVGSEHESGRLPDLQQVK